MEPVDERVKKRSMWARAEDSRLQFRSVDCSELELELARARMVTRTCRWETQARSSFECAEGKVDRVPAGSLAVEMQRRLRDHDFVGQVIRLPVCIVNCNCAPDVVAGWVWRWHRVERRRSAQGIRGRGLRRANLSRFRQKPGALRINRHRNGAAGERIELLHAGHSGQPGKLAYICQACLSLDG